MSIFNYILICLTIAWAHEVSLQSKSGRRLHFLEETHPQRTILIENAKKVPRSLLTGRAQNGWWSTMQPEVGKNFSFEVPEIQLSRFLNCVNSLRQHMDAKLAGEQFYWSSRANYYNVSCFIVKILLAFESQFLKQDTLF